MSARPTAPRKLPWWGAILSAALGGVLFDLANPGTSWWPLVFPAIALILASWWHQRVGLALATGAVAGIAFWGPHISWLTLYLGPVPWLGLCGAMTAWFVLQGLATSLVTRGLHSALRRRNPFLTVAAQSVAVTGIWVLREGVQGLWPYGGFAWGRVALVFADSPFGALVSWLGFAGLTGLVVCATALTTGCVALRLRRGPRVSSIAAGAIVAAFALLMLVPAAGLDHTGTLTVAAVQGNSKSGIFDDRESGDVYRGYVDGTERLLDELEASGRSVDVIVWPENSGEFGLTNNLLRELEVARLAKRADAPIVLGSVLQNADGTYTNSSLVWGPDGQMDPIESTRYDKRFPVPFAEYMPNRDFFHMFAPDLVDLVQLEYLHGTTPPVLPVRTNDGVIAAGVAICFDITFDNQAVEMMRNGAEVIFAQTNNADFGRTDENVQQLQIARLRAIETGRALVNISTVGTSRIVSPNGSDLAEVAPYSEGSMVASVPLVSGNTPAIRFGALISGAWMVCGGAALLVSALALQLRSPRARD